LRVGRVGGLDPPPSVSFHTGPVDLLGADPVFRRLGFPGTVATILDERAESASGVPRFPIVLATAGEEESERENTQASLHTHPQSHQLTAAVRYSEIAERGAGGHGRRGGRNQRRLDVRGAPRAPQGLRSQKKHRSFFTFSYHSALYSDGLSIAPSTHTSVWPMVVEGSKIITPFRVPICDVFGNC
jgi:hypothetical protein